MGPDVGSLSALLRPAFELALVVARTEQGAVPPIPAPRALRQMLAWVKLPDRALATIERVLEEDDAFRSRVAEVAAGMEDALGRAGWLWLTRPDGWQEELERLRLAADADAEAEREEHAERGARRRLGAAEEARRRAEDAAAGALTAAARAEEELLGERQARRALEPRLAALEADVAAARERSRVAEQSAAASRAALTEARQAVLETTSERDRLAARVAELEGELGTARARLAGVESAAADDRRALARAVGDAGRAAASLGAALTRASALLGDGETEPVPPVSAPAQVLPPAAGPAPGGGTPADGQVRGARPRGPRRMATPLPPAVFEESAEAAEHLVRVPGMQLLVDGYNVSKAAWPEVGIPEQRRRLLDALAELFARTGVAVLVIFDGAEQPAPSGASGRPRAPVRYIFSPPDVEADEVLIERVDTLPVHQPVLVATSDRRVQDEVRRRGANVISTPQLLGLLGRAR